MYNLRLAIPCSVAVLLVFIVFLQKNLPTQTLRSPSPIRRTRVKRLPTALLIGVKKGGTGALINMLGLHPRIAAATQEIHFFDKNFDKGYSWYREQLPFSSPDQVVMEKSPAYFVIEEVPERVWNLSKKMRLLLLLRNPVTRIVSDFMQGQHKRRGRPLRVAEMSAEELRRVQAGLRRRVSDKNGVLRTHVRTIDVGIYEKHLRRWLRVFPRNQLFVASAEEFASNPVPVLRRAEHFLGIDVPVAFPWEQWVKPGRTKKFYCLRRDKRRASSVITDTKCMKEDKGREHIPLPVDLEDKLYNFYAPLNEKLFAFLGQRFNWTRPKHPVAQTHQRKLVSH